MLKLQFVTWAGSDPPTPRSGGTWPRHHRADRLEHPIRGRSRYPQRNARAQASSTIAPSLPPCRLPTLVIIQTRVIKHLFAYQDAERVRQLQVLDE